MKKKFSAALLALLIIVNAVPVFAEGEKAVRVLFTHDIHSHLDGAAELAAVISSEKEAFGAENCLLFDGGDFSQGTLYQAGYMNYAFELGLLSELSYDAVAIGNHEWDCSGRGFCAMLRSAMDRYEGLPPLLCANIDLGARESDEQKELCETLAAYNAAAGEADCGVCVIEAGNGIRVGVIALAGEDSIADSPTSGMRWKNYIETAKALVPELKSECDIVVALSHSGTDGAGQGEDIELAKAVPEIDLIISAHSHTRYEQPVQVGNCRVVSAECYMHCLGAIDISVAPDGSCSFANYRLIDIDAREDADPQIEAFLDDCRKLIKDGYLAPYGFEADTVLAKSSFDFMSCDDMYALNEEFPLGDLIADSYIYEARKNGVFDIDVALVGLGTIRESISAGDITVADAFEICSLGVGSDDSAGHPLVCCYVTGRELKLFAELEASFSPKLPSIKMSYSGLRCSFDTNRIVMDRIRRIELCGALPKGDGREIEDDELYKVCVNMYAANMLGMLNGLSHGILSITPKMADGTPVENFYDCVLKDGEGREIKEWYAFADYLQYLGDIPEEYEQAQGRKEKITTKGLLAKLENPGLATKLVLLAAVLIIALLALIIKLIVSAVKTRRRKADGDRSRRS